MISCFFFVYRDVFERHWRTQHIYERYAYQAFEVAIDLKWLIISSDNISISDLIQDSFYYDDL